MRHVVLTVAIACLVSVTPLAAQTQITTGVIQGTVQDSTGAVLPGVDVTVVSVETNLTQNRTTDSDGRFVFLQLPPGRYTATAKLAGFGTFVQDIGQLQVFKVREKTSAAQITFTCDEALLGDLVAPVPERESPIQRADANLDVFADPSGKHTGRLMMAKDNRELITRNDIVYIDLGAEDQLKTGDYLTVYRPLGTGNITRVDDDEMSPNREDGFQSNRLRGGGFSGQANRAKDEKGDGSYRGGSITSREVKLHRPPMPRKIVGEIVVIDVQSRTATAIITRVAGEVHTGDWVEIQ